MQDSLCKINVGMSKKRYFIVSYNYSNDRVYGSGKINILTDGCYLNESKTIEQIKSTLTYEASVVIINVIELSKSDYNDWVNEPEG